MRHSIACMIVGALIGASVIGATWYGQRDAGWSRATLTEYTQNLVGGNDELQHACIPTDTGGGVWQCAQPTRQDTALRACLLNDAYVGVTQENTRHLLVQCMDDYLAR
jgi:hypothetical protein